ncbi:MAG: hypothetical protein BMS9Abin20_0090 [Acidimicrobiia bacterium]|nr:MAG: hypothetical protein BMS9Abin20_0090 [Acidimicrobiia bacterium]
MKNDADPMSGKVLAPLLVGFVLVVMVVIARANAPDRSTTPTTLDFTSGTTVTSVTAPTSTSTTTPVGETTPKSRGATLQAFLQAPGWRSLSGGDLRPRTGFATVWTDDRFVVWGGVDFLGNEVQRQGAPYRSDGWQEMEQSPIVAGVDPVLVWTGRELFAYSGAAAAWNPNTNTWRTLAYPPTGSPGGGGPIAGVWADNRVILVGYRTHPPVFDDNLFVASYGPDLGCCDVLPEPPFSLSYADAFWTGQEMLLIGALVDAEGEPMTNDGLGRFAGFDPRTGTWTEYDPPPLPQADRISAAWTGAAVVAWDARLNAAEWTKERGWRTLPDVPLPRSDCRPQSTAISDTEVAALDRNDVVAVLCGEVAIWDAEADRWFSIVGPQAVIGDPPAACGVEGSLTWPSFYLWCSGSTSTSGQFFWQIDSSDVEASQYSEPATPSQWELLPNPAATRLGSTTMVWSGNELLYFSGQGIEVEEFGGWGYDPDRNIMHRIPGAPSPGRSGQVALWTGDEMLVWRGPTTLWNPISLEWRTAEQSPALGSSPFAVWTGDEAIFYGSRIEPSNTGAAYNPDTDTWRPVATGPAGVAVGVQVMAWSGEEMYVLGNYGGFPASQSGTVYDPTSDRWRPLPPIPEEFALSGSVGDFVDGEFIIIGENWDPLLTEEAPLIAGLAYSPESNTWRTIAPVRTLDDALARPPETHFTTRMAAVRHGDELAVFLPAGYSSDTPTIAFYNPATDTWRYVDGAPANASGPTMVSGDTFVAYLTSAGTVLLHDD